MGGDETIERSGQNRDTGLFRTEVFEARKAKNDGRVNLLPSVSWHVITAILLGLFLGGVAFVALVPLARTETVDGVIWPHGKPVSLDSPISGTITSISAGEDDLVDEGELLVTVADRTAIGFGEDAAKIVERGIEARRLLVANEMDAARRDNELAISERRSRIGALISSKAATQNQITRQLELLASAREDFEIAQTVAVGGFISRQDLARRQEAVLAREQVLAQLKQEIVDIESQIAIERAGIKRDTESLATRLASLESTEEAFGLESAQAARNSSVALLAPVSGRVGALRRTPGQRIAVGEEILLIANDKLEWLVELQVPSSAISRVRVGGAVELRVASLPYQQYGTIEATITRIATIPEQRSDSDGSSTYYRVNARMNPSSELSASLSSVQGLPVEVVMHIGRATILEQILAERTRVQL
ncbi:HlyD family efflux transporter periplasmic adaptor subunit [Erythrobacter vulgaris]|uniref:HlyD family efflux transporter periplasmic adaptor subunit n=1 Tax=Qipengyuania vulgaris TaxID=291985 RepID=A0A844XNR6_9SPHN|nr:HlyD family efflux transporter periplasmic adaptor subunit [Qipengyuania vulgaris]MXO47631.1 HlyD family efflux transporter periplasmic adaptor subunit [Qipengyuania vulgaris]